MNTEKLLANLRKYTLLRLRSINVKIAGNMRWGFYREYNIDDIHTLISEFHQLAPTDNSTTAPTNELPTEVKTFRTGSNYAILSRLCEQYYIYEGSDKLRKKLIDEVTEIIEELRNDPASKQEMETMLNTRHDNIMTEFRAQFPQLKEKDYQLYAYLVAGFSTTTIAVLLGKEKSVIYNRVSRLKRNIRNSDSTERQRFIDILPS